MGNAFLHTSDEITRILPAAAESGDVIPLLDGRIGILTGLNDAAAGDYRGCATTGVYNLVTASALCILPGTRVYWDPVNETTAVKWATGYHYAGVAVAESPSGTTVCAVDINAEPKALIDVEDPKNTFTSAATDGLGTTWHLHDGLGYIILAFDAVAEVAKADLLSDRSIPNGDGFLFHCLAAIYDIGDDAALDINLGVASATHASDCDSIAEAVLFHLDGSALSINAESDDGTTEVAATDTTVDAVDDTYHLFQIDARDLTDIQLYIDGVNVLPDSVFTLEDGSAAIKALVHLEKTSNNTTADVRVRELRLTPTA